MSTSDRPHAFFTSHDNFVYFVLTICVRPRDLAAGYIPLQRTSDPNEPFTVNTRSRLFFSIIAFTENSGVLMALGITPGVQKGTSSSHARACANKLPQEQQHESPEQSAMNLNKIQRPVTMHDVTSPSVLCTRTQRNTNAKRVFAFSYFCNYEIHSKNDSNPEQLSPPRKEADRFTPNAVTQRRADVLPWAEDSNSTKCRR